MMIELLTMGKINSFCIQNCKFYVNKKIRPKHDDEMCDVYAMYSYEPILLNNDKWKGYNPLLEYCWGNYPGNITR